MTRPRLLDLFCCEGGAAIGYERAGFEVVGIDRTARFAKRYPFEFHAADALEYVAEHGHKFDAIHTSPPCQPYSITRHSHSKEHPKLIEPTREALIASGKPYIIENVAGAPLIDPLVLCWSQFNEAGSVIDDDGTPLRMERHRLFESNILLTAPSRPHHHDRTIQVAGSYGGARSDKHEARNVRHGGYVPSREVQQQLLGVDHMTLHGMYQSLPPDYTEFLGYQLLDALTA